MKKVYLTRSGVECCRRVMDCLDLNRYAVVNGFTLVSEDHIKDADYCILVTCGSPDNSLELSRKRLEYVRQYFDDDQILVLGCISKTDPDFRSKFSGRCVSPSDYVDQLDKCILDMGIAENIACPYVHLDHATTGYDDFIPFFTKDHWMISIESGCLGSCKYCRIKSAIGSLVSEPVAKIETSFRKGLQKGFSKFWLMGDDIGAYGLDIGETFPGLISKLSMIGDKQSNPYYFDLRTIINTKWIAKYRNEILAIFRKNPERFVSIGFGIQSAVSRLLRLSNRADVFIDATEVINEIRAISPECFMTSHMIIGLPTETIKETEKNFEYILNSPIDLFSCFQYSHLKGSVFSDEYPSVDNSANVDHFLELVKKSPLYFHKPKKSGLVYVLRRPRPEYFVYELTKGTG